VDSPGWTDFPFVLDHAEAVHPMGSVIERPDNRVAASWRTATGELVRLCVSALTFAGAASTPCALTDHRAASEWAMSLAPSRQSKRLVRDLEGWLRDASR
jgi:hypothetical protein